MKKCCDCGKHLKSAHRNRKRCIACAAIRVKFPKSNLTDKQKKLARKLAGTMFYEKLALHIGCSRSSLSRFAREEGFSLDHNSYSQDEVEAVCKYYEKHGQVATEKKFPDVSVRSVVESYPSLFKSRCDKWTDSQFVELAKMAGIIPLAKQAKYFKRPRANAGSIRSVWVKRFGIGYAQINGMFHHNAKHIIKKHMFLPVASNGSDNKRRPMLWVDIEDNLKDGLPKFMSTAIGAMASFQRKIHGAKNNQQCKKMILKMITTKG